MIQLIDLTFSFADAESPTLNRINLGFEDGEFALVCGPTGSGKSTLLKAMNGLVPHFTSGNLSGQINLANKNLAGAKPHEFAPYVGFVNQQAETSFVADRVDEEIAFGLEQLGFTQTDMHSRIKATAQLLGLSEVVCDNLTELSGGQQQRVAIAAALAVGQKILLLDEPTSELDPAAANELLVLLRDIAHENQITVLIAEHRIERALDLVDSVTVVHGDSTVNKAMKADGLDPILLDYRMVPPAVELGQRLHWKPLALSVSEAKTKWLQSAARVESNVRPPLANTRVALELSNVSIKYGDHTALDNASFTLSQSSITALMGPNGSGKSSLMWAMQGSQGHLGEIKLASGEQPSQLKPLERLAHIAMVPQTATDLLMHNSISEELSDSDEVADVPNGTTSQIFATLAGRIDPKRHPRDLSHGQQLSLALAIQMAKGANILLLDEPTRGLDYQSKRQLADLLDSLRASGRSILVASHDVEFLALVADEIIRVENGKVVSHGPSLQVLAELGELAPQIWQVTQQFLTVEDALLNTVQKAQSSDHDGEA